MIHHGDCLDVMASMEPESVSAVVTDPPYGISFMAKDWDAPGAVGNFPTRRTKAANTVNTGVSRQGGRQQQGLDFQKRQGRDARAYQESSQAWAAEAYRVAKPSAYLLAFGGTRTVHRLVSGIEDAGWIIRDMLVWAYASGFPKSKASLKPAWEPIVMARKPGPLAMLNIDGCRIQTTDAIPEFERSVDGRRDQYRTGTTKTLRRNARGGDNGLVGSDTFRIHDRRVEDKAEPAGRWPTNVILTDPIFDGGWDGVVGGGETSVAPPGRWTDQHQVNALFPKMAGTQVYADSGTYSRFFLIPKADRAEREPIAGMLPDGFAATMGNGIGGREHDPANPRAYRQNVHPTVKPVDLMRHLVRLVTPPGGIVLDPFLGSGTTAIAAEMEGFPWIGIEREVEYVAIAEARLEGVQRGMGLVG